MKQLHSETPVFESAPISTAAGKPVYLKMECFQPAGSFKIRGIGRLCQEHAERGAARLVSSSGGNAGFAVAWAGRQLGAGVTVVVPETTADDVSVKIGQTGAEVLVHGAVWDETHAYALELAQRVGGAYVHPFDHASIWRGHSTIVDEIAGQCAKPGAIVVSVGGGGLLCGVVEGLQRHGWQDVPVVAAETVGTCSLARSIEAGRLVTLERICGVATTLGAKRVAAQAFDYSQRHRVIPHIATDAAAVAACLRFSEDHRILVEPACGAALSVVYGQADVIRLAHSVLVIVCGGIGASIAKLLEWQAENPGEPLVSRS